ncbi:MAG: lipase maturation factor family protein [Polyangiales bacterium]
MIWSGLDPMLVWGLIPRFVGVLYVFAFGALAPQLVGIIGKRGAAPLAPRLARMSKDFPGVRRFLEWPTVFWLSASDTTIRTVPWIGIVAGFMAMYGGPIGYVGLLIGWFLWLSVEPAGLIFPWDTMLQEAGFFALFLPLVVPLPELVTTALPLPTVTFMFRWLVLRLMLGFAKVKFIGTGKGDSMYLRGFLIWAPMPTPLAWWAHHAPRWVLKASLYFMFYCEAIAPMLGFFSGPLRIVSFASLTALMIGIQLTGNWGFFNIGYVLLCVSLLDVNASVFDVFAAPWSERALTFPDAAIHLAMLLLFYNSIFYFLFTNSWVTRTWLQWHWDAPLWNKPFWRTTVRWLRFFAPFHMVNGYGVFPPIAAPPIRFAPVFEGSNDGKTWKAYGFKHLPSTPEQKLPIVAPYHPRFDQGLTYGSIGIHDGSFFSSTIGDGNPYLAYLRFCWLDRAAQHVLRHDEEMKREIGFNPFGETPPKLVRVSTYVLAPTTPAELRATGHRWRVRRLGTLLPARASVDWVEKLSVPEPELFHPEFVHFKKRAEPLRALRVAFEAGQPLHEAVLAGGEDLSAADVRLFWAELVPMVQEGRGDWTRVHERAEAIRARFDPYQLHRLERILQRYTWLLRLRTEHYFERDLKPKIELNSLFRYEMFLHEVVFDGPDAMQAILDQPALAAERAARTTDQTQIWGLAMLRYDMVMFHACTFRWNEIGRHGHHYKIHGIFEYYELLAQLPPLDEEFCPNVIKHDDGEFTIEGLYTSPLKPA